MAVRPSIVNFFFLVVDQCFPTKASGALRPLQQNALVQRRNEAMPMEGGLQG